MAPRPIDRLHTTVPLTILHQEAMGVPRGCNCCAGRGGAGVEDEHVYLVNGLVPSHITYRSRSQTLAAKLSKHHTTESVDSVCGDGTDMPYAPYKQKPRKLCQKELWKGCGSYCLLIGVATGTWLDLSAGTCIKDSMQGVCYRHQIKGRQDFF